MRTLNLVGGRQGQSVLAPSSDALVTSSFLLLVVRPGAPSSVLAPSSDALSLFKSFLICLFV